MKILVLMKEVPDLVEELELTDDGRLAVDELSYVPSEWDDQALEEALIIREEHGGHEITVLAFDTGDADTMLYTALAKGADRAIKLVGQFGREMSNRARAAAVAQYLQGHSYDLVLTGVQAIDDLDGQVAGLVAGLVGWPHASVVRDVTPQHDGIHVIQEYAGGRMAELRLSTPCILGVQAARKPPRYVTVAKVRQAQKAAKIDEVEVVVPDVPEIGLRRLYQPQATGQAQMWGDDIEQVVDNLVALLKDRKLIRS
jgi:electron transfer flavoprotein beta subunit